MPERELKVRLSADAKRFRRGMRGAETSFLSLKAAVAAGSAVIAAGIAASVREAMKFEDSMAGVAKTVDASEQTVRLLGERFQELSTEIPVSANELAKLGQVAGQLGVQTSKIENFVETTAKLSTAVDGLSGEQAATQLARFANVAGTSQDQFENLASSLVELGNNVAANEAEILNFAQNVVQAGRQIELTEAEIMGLSASMVALGTNAEAGGTALQRAFIGMQDAVRSGSDELVAFARLAGMSTEEFARTFREDASEAVQAFFEGITRANERGESLTEVMEAMDLQSERTIRALLAAARASDQLEGNMGQASEAFRENVALQEEAERRFDTSSAQMETAINNWRQFAEQVGGGMTPTVVRLSEVLSGSADVMSSVANRASAASPEVATLRENLDELALSAERMTGAQIDAQIVGLTRRLQELQSEFAEVQGGSMLRARMQALQATPLDFIADAFAGGAGEARKRIRQQVEAINESLETLQAMRRELGESGEAAGDAAADTDRLSRGLEELESRAMQTAGSLRTLEELYGEIVDRSTGPLPTQMDELGHPLADNIMSDAEINRLREGLGRVEEVMGERTKQLAEKQTGELEKLLSRGGQRAGEALIEGIIMGSENMGDMLKRMMARIASTFIMSQLTGALGIGSPSKKGVWVGEMLSEGVALGIEGRSRRVASASRNVAASAERALLRGGPGGGAGPAGAGGSGRVVAAVARALREVPPPEFPSPEAAAAAEYEQRKVRRALEVASGQGFNPSEEDAPLRSRGRR